MTSKQISPAHAKRIIQDWIEGEDHVRLIRESWPDLFAAYEALRSVAEGLPVETAGELPSGGAAQMTELMRLAQQPVETAGNPHVITEYQRGFDDGFKRAIQGVRETTERRCLECGEKLSEPHHPRCSAVEPTGRETSARTAIEGDLVPDHWWRVHRELANGHISAALAVVAAVLDGRALPECAACA